MSSTRSADLEPILVKGWFTQVLTILWALTIMYWALLVVALFPLTQSEKVQITTVSIALLLFAGTALIASIRGKETLGGGLLIAGGVLTILSFADGPHSPLLLMGSFSSLLMEEGCPALFSILVEKGPLFQLFPIYTMALPPLVAGALFLVSQRRSNDSTRRGNESQK